jgi:hypothetical protein
VRAKTARPAESAAAAADQTGDRQREDLQAGSCRQAIFAADRDTANGMIFVFGHFRGVAFLPKSFGQFRFVTTAIIFAKISG